MTYPWVGAARPMPPQAMEDAARRLGCDTAAIRAVWDIEAGGKNYLSDGSVIRRFEPHHMPGSSLNWLDSKALTRGQREKAFMQAFKKNPEAALRASSWGGPQIMGFNAAKAGHPSSEAMVQAFADSAQAQLDGFVDLVTSWGLDSAIRAHDWGAFARRWNGSGQVSYYAGRMEKAYRRHSGGAKSPQVLRVGDRGAAVKKLQRALGISADGVFGPRTKEQTEAFQSKAGLAVDGVVGQRTWAALETARNAKPATQRTNGEAMADKVAKYGSVAGTVTGAAASANRVIPAEALPTIYIIAAAAVAVAALIYLVRRLR